MKDYDNYLFDADGTLFDTTELICQCFEYSLQKYSNKPVVREKIIATIGLPLRIQFEHHLGRAISDDLYNLMQTDHMDYQMRIYKNYLKPCPGVRQALDRLHSLGKQLAIVTSRKIHSLTLYLKETGIDRFFNVIVTPDETRNHKPDPEPALKALDLLNARPDRSLFIGDSSFDIECGNRAGIDTAFVGWSHNRPDTMMIQPTYVIGSMLDLVTTAAEQV